MTEGGSEKSARLRRESENPAAGEKSRNRNMSTADMVALVHELEMHQIELELQNEELQRAQRELQATHDHYADMFEFAPVGYFVLDLNFLIMEVNFAGSQILNLERSVLSGRSFTEFVQPEYRDRFRHSFKANGSESGRSCEIKMRRQKGGSFFAELEVVKKTTSTVDAGYRVVLLDVTERKRAEDALAESERKYRALVENANSIIVRWDREGVIQFINEFGLRFFGYSQEELIGHDVMIIVPKVESDTGRNLEALVKDIVQHPKRHMNVPSQNIRKDGTISWVTWTNEAILDERGSVKEILAIGNDITALKEAETSLKENEQRMQMALAIGNSFSFEWEPVADRVLRSQSCTAILGLPGDEATNDTGQRYFQRVHPDDRERFMRILDELAPSSDSYRTEYRVARGDGSTVVLEETGRGSFDANGKLCRLIGVATDISERKRMGTELAMHRDRLEALVDARTEELRKANEVLHAEIARRRRIEERLEQSELRMERAFQAGELGIWDLNLETGAAWRSPRHDQIFGYERLLPEWTLDTLMEHLLPEHRSRLDELVQHAFSDGKGWSYECRIRRADGVVRWIWMQGEPYRFEDNRPTRAIGVVRDITAQKEIEKQVVELNEDLRLRARQLRALAGELARSEQRERRRLAKILHDHLQQLLVAAKFRAEILGRSEDEITRKAASEIADLIGDCVAESRSLTFELSPPILHEGSLTEGMQWLSRMMADKHGLIVDLSMEENLPSLVEDVKILLFESIRELLFNAVKHAHVGSARVNIRQVESREIRITVSDRGPGFDPADLNKAVEMGGGFGLFSIRERLDLIGGRIEVASSSGKGSRFILRVPLDKAAEARMPVVEPAPRQAAAIQAEKAELPKRGTLIRVLLADDHAVVREGLTRVLDKEPDIEVVGEAADGQEATELAQRLLPDVILMDVSMPRLNGVEATRAIHNSHPDIRIIGLSMFEESDRMQAMRDAGAADYLTKSGPSRAIIKSIRACIKTGASL